jgi:hypothetical protein
MHVYEIDVGLRPLSFHAEKLTKIQQRNTATRNHRENRSCICRSEFCGDGDLVLRCLVPTFLELLGCANPKWFVDHFPKQREVC